MPEAIAAITGYQPVFCYNQDGRLKPLLEHSNRADKSKRIWQRREGGYTLVTVKGRGAKLVEFGKDGAKAIINQR